MLSCLIISTDEVILTMHLIESGTLEHVAGGPILLNWKTQSAIFRLPSCRSSGSDIINYEWWKTSVTIDQIAYVQRLINDVVTVALKQILSKSHEFTQITMRNDSCAVFSGDSRLVMQIWF